MADRTPAPRQSGDAHEDLLATLAASRELGPEMDQSLAESYMRKHGQPAPAAQQPGQPAQQHPGYAGLAAIGPALGIAVYIVLLIVSGGRLWWMFWLPMALGGWWGGMWGGWWGGDPWHVQRDEWRYQRRMTRDQYRAWRRGYGYPPAPYDDPRRPGDYPRYPAPRPDPREPGQPPTPPSAPGRDVL